MLVHQLDTAYALSAGGPILHPNLDAITIVPISPHTLSNRPIAVSGDSEILIKIVNMDEAYARSTGQIQIPLDKKDTIRLKKLNNLFQYCIHKIIVILRCLEIN